MGAPPRTHDCLVSTVMTTKGRMTMRTTLATAWLLSLLLLWLLLLFGER